MAREIAIERLADLANDLDDQLGGGAAFEDAARALDLPLLTIEAVDASGRDRAGEQPEGLPAEPNFLRTAFSTPVGEDSLLGELGDGGYFVLRVEGETPPAVRPFEEAKPLVLEAWRAERLDEAAKARADALAARLREGRTPASVAGGLAVEQTGSFARTDSDPEIGLSGAVVEAVFAADSLRDRGGAGRRRLHGCGRRGDRAPALLRAGDRGDPGTAFGPRWRRMSGSNSTLRFRTGSGSRSTATCSPSSTDRKTGYRQQ